METIRFVDTTIRDGHQSLWAENMTTGMMLPIAQRLDDAGFEGIELISGSHLKKAVRELKEDPWERVRLVSKIITKTPLRLIAGRVNTFEYNPPSMYRLFVERMFANGIREARISDEWNDPEGWKFRVGECHRAGMKSILNLQSDPQIQAILTDPAIVQAIQDGDYTTLLANPKIKALESNEQLKQLLRQQEH